MSENQAEERIKELQTAIRSDELPQAARLPGDSGRWTRRRAMPVDDMVRCALAKQGLSAVMEIRHYFQKTASASKRTCAKDSI